ncbi:hypothetical protein N7462_000133 [Penicillium macrosclerotiorum]|uniref:uncharacterized protein n=1 Tax=Penicillium macrosclerotiorum TaxID=303699 RepID=UPI0025467EFA|nr:uncharacterized protein N7462_000133 [Penicillium macrosclerotiorum]KAJ5698128.1 hypothetical protein N7462_000133 [Penicillium macrosclerotiorum]
MKFTEKKFRFFNLRSKKEGETRSSLDTASSCISTAGSLRETSNWLRGSGKNVQLASVNEQTAELLKTTNHIIHQLHETQRLRGIKDRFLSSRDKTWIDTTVQDVEDAVHDVSILLEPTRVELETGDGRLSLTRQLRWVYRDSQRARDKSHRLLACHSSLIAVLTHLQRLDAPERAAVQEVHELGAEVPSKSTIYSCSSVQESVSVLSESGGKWNKSVVALSSNNEMHDLLAWRQSRGTAS